MSWSVLTSTSSHELSACRELASLGISSYCPVTKCLTKPKRKSKPIESIRAAFPGYLFAQPASIPIDFSAIPVLNSARLRYLRLGEFFCTVDDTEIERMRSGDDDRSEIKPQVKFFRNDQVTITSGPFVGRRGEIASVKGQRCELIIFGSATKVTMPTFCLQKEQGELLQ